MNVIITIDGREAIPVRAIPLLANWKVMSPQVVARALAGDENYDMFRNMSAYRRESDEVISIPPMWWESFVCRQLKALSESIKATQITHETGYQEWRRQSLPLLPAGVFVWKDEFVPLFEQQYSPENFIFLSSKTSSRAIGLDEHKRRTTLDFNPFILEQETCCSVMEGFEPQPAQLMPSTLVRQLLQPSDTQPQATPVLAPVVEAPEPGNRWTPEKLAELAAYRDAHTMPETAEKFGISEQRIRQLQPRKKPRPSPFAGLVHHME